MRGPDQKSEKALRGELARTKARMESLQQQNKDLRAIRDKFNSKRKLIVKEELMKNTGITDDQLNMMVNGRKQIKHWSIESLVLPLIQAHSIFGHAFNQKSYLGQGVLGKLTLKGQTQNKNFANISL